MRIIKLRDALIPITIAYGLVILVSYFMGEYTVDAPEILLSYLTSIGVFIVIYFTQGKKVK